MEMALKVMAAVALGMLLFFMWPVYKHWSKNGPRANKGDWMNVFFIFGIVVLFVSLLILSVQ